MPSKAALKIKTKSTKKGVRSVSQSVGQPVVGVMITYYARKCIVERVPERKADLERLYVGQVTGYAPEEHGRDGHT